LRLRGSRRDAIHAHFFIADLNSGRQINEPDGLPCSDE
jgi:hypothetical protein